MSLFQWGLESGIKGILDDANRDGKVSSLVESAENLISGFFPGSTKTVKQKLIKGVIFPFAKMLLKDDPAGYEDAKTVL